MKFVRLARPFGCACMLVLCMGGMAFSQSAVAGNTSVSSSDIKQRILLETSKHRAAQAKAESAFVNTLAGKTDEEKRAAVKAHMAEKYAAERDFRVKMHELESEQRQKAFNARIAYMKEKLKTNTELTAEEKAAMVSREEQRFASNTAFKDSQFAEAQKLAEQLNAENLTKDQRAALIREHSAKAQAAAKSHEAEEIQQGKEFRQEMRSKQRQLKAAQSVSK